jgi:adenosine deaminase
VRYLELRTTPRETRDGAGRVTISKDNYIITVLDTIAKFKRQQEEQFAEDKERMAVYLILSVDRAKDALAQAMEVVDLALKHYDRGIIVGIDLCGNPTKGDVSIYKDAYAKAKCRGLKVTLHFAEMAFSGGLPELETLLSFQPDRIGHVIHVPDTIKEKITERNIGLELCMSCNVHAKMVHGSFEDHHFGYWWKTNCPIALCVCVNLSSISSRRHANLTVVG